jgi:hypothetical protein
MKAESKIYKGIQFVQLNELPVIQQDHLLQTFDHSYFIKIMIDGKIISHCMQYKDYSLWYENVFNAKAEPAKEKRIPELVEINANLALNKY